MNKTQAIQLCKSLLARGIYTKPIEHPYYHDWAVIVLHDVNDFGCELEGCYFVDCTCTFLGCHETVDYPIFARKS